MPEGPGLVPSSRSRTGPTGIRASLLFNTAPPPLSPPGEDLEEFAGAGLYSSVPLSPLQPTAVAYAQEPLVWDSGFR